MELYSSRLEIPEAVFGKPCNAGRIIEAEGDCSTGYGITCINCPMGCSLNVVMKNGSVHNVTGAACKRGIAYAELECTNPTRIVTSTVPVCGGGLRRVSVKTESAIPKSKIAACLHSLKEIELEVPVKIGAIVVHNVGNTGVDIVATRNVRAS